MRSPPNRGRPQGAPDHDQVWGDFRKLAREVELFGASALAGRDKKRWQAEYLAKLGAKPPKRPRVSPMLGRATKRNQDARQARQEEEDIASGMLSAKVRASAKKRARFAERASEEDRGLRLSEGIFKSGVLHVRPLPAKSQPDVRSERERPEGFGGKRGGGKGKKGKGKRKGGDKSRKNKGKGKGKRR